MRMVCLQSFVGKTVLTLSERHQVSLFYKVPIGAMEAYRAVVEAEHARSEEVWNDGGERLQM